MSAAPAAEAAEAPKKGKKKLLIIIIAAVVVLAGGGVGAMLMLKKKPAEGEEGADGHAKAEAKKPAAEPLKFDPKNPPVYFPLEPFTVNLADRDAERYLQVAMSLEIIDVKTGDQMKLLLPAIRNNILMVLSHKTAPELIAREGKDKLSKEIQRETERALGIEPDEEDEDEEEEKPKKKKKKKKKAETARIVTAVHYSNFIIQ